MKKILLLGGSTQQIIAIETAKKLGYATVLCDYLPDNPGQYVADQYYQVSTTEKEAILEIARKEHIDGIIAYASDPAAPTAAYVAEQLGLPGNPYASVEILCHKDQFRAFLNANGFHAPMANGYASVEAAIDDIGRYHLPLIVKPVDASGSKGATVLHTLSGLEQAITAAFSFSRSRRIIVEEFVEKKHPYLIGGDIFVWDGKVILWGLMNCHRNSRVNPLVPVGKSYPPELEACDLERVKTTLQELVEKLHIQSGAMNVELIVDQSGSVWPIDIGPRNGGNLIPDLLGYIFGVDVVKMSIQTAMGEPVKEDIGAPDPFYATYNLHSHKSGIFEEVRFSNAVEPYLIRTCIYKRPGDVVEYFDNASKALGVVFFHFSSQKEMDTILGSLLETIEIKIKEKPE